MSSLEAYIRAVRGPFVLITVGTLFALSQQGIASFRQTWPVVLIVIGLLKLAEHLVRTRNTA